MGYNNNRAVWITVILLVLLIGVVSCIVIKSKPSGPAAPVSTVEPVEVEDDDFICEWDDHPREPECIGKTVPPKPGTVATKAPVKTPGPIRTTKRRS